MFSGGQQAGSTGIAYSSLDPPGRDCSWVHVVAGNERLRLGQQAVQERQTSPVT
jgi:hypothetical protein